MGEPVQGKTPSRNTAQVPKMNHLQLPLMEVLRTYSTWQRTLKSGEKEKRKRKECSVLQKEPVSHHSPPLLEQFWTPYPFTNTAALFLTNKLYNFTSAYTGNKNKVS